MGEYEPTSFEDALSLLEFEDRTWVSFARTMILPFHQVKARLHGVWNYVFDVHVFWNEKDGPELIFICEGGEVEAAQWDCYRADERLCYWFLRRFRECSTIASNILLADRDLHP